MKGTPYHFEKKIISYIIDIDGSGSTTKVGPVPSAGNTSELKARTPISPLQIPFHTTLWTKLYVLGIFIKKFDS